MQDSPSSPQSSIYGVMADELRYISECGAFALHIDPYPAKVVETDPLEFSQDVTRFEQACCTCVDYSRP